MNDSNHKKMNVTTSKMIDFLNPIIINTIIYHDAPTNTNMSNS